MPNGARRHPPEAFVASACSGNPRRARRWLAADPLLAHGDLASACAAGAPDDVALLIAADVGAAQAPTGPNDWPPLLYVCFSRLGRTDPPRQAALRACARVLLDAGADPNASFMHGDWLQTTLYGAAGIAGDAALTEMLLRAGADPNDRSAAHRVGEALYHACEQRDPAAARLLIDAGTEPEVVDFCLGRALNFDNPAMVRAFCDGGARPSAGHLHQALWRARDAGTVASLLDAGAPVDEVDDLGLTALQIALLWGEGDVPALLRECDAAPGGAAREGSPDPVERSEVRDAMLIFAIQRGDAEWVRRLLDAGTAVDGPAGAEFPPLAEACWRGRVEIVADLVARGAALTWGEGSAAGATRHGSRHCHDPEGGPTMATRAEIPQEPYTEITAILEAAGAE